MTASMNNPLAQLRAHSAAVVATSRKTVQQFAEKLAQDPAHAFGWADNAYYAAAQLKMYGALECTLSRMLEGELKVHGRDVSLVEALRLLHAQHTDLALRAARWPARSPSPSANQIEADTARAAAEIAELIGHELDAARRAAQV